MSDKLQHFEYGKFTQETFPLCPRPFTKRLSQAEAELLYAQSLFKTTEALNTSDPRVPKLDHPLIECSVCHKLIEEPNIEECEFCNEDVCDDCWDKHKCEQPDPYEE